MSETPETLAPDPTRCPLCGQANDCASEAERATGRPQPPCWCLDAHFDEALLRRVPAAAQGRACICARCAAQSTPSAGATGAAKAARA